MLDFLLVLGQIPGTNIELSFWQIVFSVLGIGLIAGVWRRPAFWHKCLFWCKFYAFYIIHIRLIRPHRN